jgi:hypothetical protein
MPTVASRITHNGPAVDVHLSGTPVREDVDYNSHSLCCDGVFTLTSKGARELAEELLHAVNEFDYNRTV